MRPEGRVTNDATGPVPGSPKGKSRRSEVSHPIASPEQRPFRWIAISSISWLPSQSMLVSISVETFWKRQRKSRGVALAVSVIFVLAIALVARRSRIVSWLPLPTGSSRVGTAIVTLPTTSSDADATPLAVQIWFPTLDFGGKHAPYAYGLPLTLRDRIVASLVRTNAFANATIRAGRFPVVLYLPGAGGSRSANTALSEELASVGYIVVALNDTRLLSGGTNFSSAEKIMGTYAWGARRVRSETTDITRAIDALGRINRDPRSSFAGRLDLTRIGMLGYSFGGAVAAETADREPRLRAAVDLDGALFGEALTRGVVRPFMIVSSEPLVDQPLKKGPVVDIDGYTRKSTSLKLSGLRRHGGYALTLADAGHYSLTDAALTPSFRHKGQGTVDPVRAFRLLSKFVVAFFDRHLKGIPTPLLLRSETNKDVIFRRFPGPANEKRVARGFDARTTRVLVMELKPSKT